MPDLKALRFRGLNISMSSLQVCKQMIRIQAYERNRLSNARIVMRHSHVILKKRNPIGSPWPVEVTQPVMGTRVGSFSLVLNIVDKISKR